MPSNEIVVDNRPWEAALQGAKGLKEATCQLSSYASGLWVPWCCPRRAYLDRVAPVDEDWDRYPMAAEHGNHVHSMVVDMFKKAGLWRGDEIRGGNTDYNISYRIDLLIQDGDRVVPVEIKSVKNEKFIEVTEGSGPYEAHLLQLQCYLHFHKPHPYPYGYLLYYNRNDDAVAMFPVPHSPEICAKIESTLFNLEFAVANKLLPKATGSTYDCRFCPHKERCK